MSDPVHVGIQLDDQECRVTYVDGGAPVVLPLPADLAHPPVIFDPHASISSIGVGFPGLLRNLGGALMFSYGDRAETADTLVQQSLARIHGSLAGATGGRPCRAVIAVPGGLTQGKRRALLERARSTEFGEVGLVDMGVAAALGHHGDQKKSKTVLTYTLGYGSCEYSLLRLSRGRCRVFASSIAERVSAEMLDALMIERLILSLRENKVFLGLKQFTSSQWSLLRQIAEQARVDLSTAAAITVTLPRELIEPEESVQIGMPAFEEVVAPRIVTTIEEVERLLEESELELEHIDEVLLIGDAAQREPVLGMLTTRLGDSCVRVDPQVVATGAAMLARQRDEGMDEATAPSDERVRVSGRRPPPGTRAQEVRPPIPGTPAGPPPGANPFESIRALVDAGRIEEADQGLVAIIEAAESARADLRAAVSRDADARLREARALLTDGQYVKAVSLSHEAQHLASKDPRVFAEMIAVHIDAGKALDQPSEYEDSMGFLRCAYSHDQTNRTIHQAMADRHYLHAVEMRRLNSLDAARQLLEDALRFDPKHERATALLEELSG